MSLFMAVIAALTLEYNSWAGYAWYTYYRIKYSALGELVANLGPIPVPDKLAPALPYVKGVIAALGVIATVVAAVFPPSSAPAFVYLVISVVTALGVYVVPNTDVKAIIQQGEVAFHSAESAVEAGKVSDVAGAEQDLHAASLAANGALGGVEAVLKGIDPVLAPLPPLPVLPSQVPAPPQPVKPAVEPEPAANLVPEPPQEPGPRPGNPTPLT